MYVKYCTTYLRFIVKSIEINCIFFSIIIRIYTLSVLSIWEIPGYFTLCLILYIICDASKIMK